MSRLCRLKSYLNIGDDGKWAYDEITQLRQQVFELQAAVKVKDEALEMCKQRMVCEPYAVTLKALSTTPSTETLNKYVAGVVRKMAEGQATLNFLNAIADKIEQGEF